MRHIPIKVYLGNEDAMKEALSYYKTRVNRYKKCYFTSHYLTYTNTFEMKQYPFKSLLKRVKLLLMDTSVEELVIVVQNSEILHHQIIWETNCTVVEVNKDILNNVDNENIVNDIEYTRILELLKKDVS